MQRGRSISPANTSNLQPTITHEPTCTSSHHSTSSTMDTSITNNLRINTDSELKMDVSPPWRWRWRNIGLGKPCDSVGNGWGGRCSDKDVVMRAVMGKCGPR